MRVDLASKTHLFFYWSSCFVILLLKTEKIPPTFLDSMTHLLVHLVHMHVHMFKEYVKNKAKPKGNMRNMLWKVRETFFTYVYYTKYDIYCHGLCLSCSMLIVNRSVVSPTLNVNPDIICHSL